MECLHRLSAGTRKWTSRRRQGDGAACFAPLRKEEQGRPETARGRQAALAREWFGLAFPAPSGKALAGAGGRPERKEQKPATRRGVEMQVHVVRKNP